MNYKTFFTTAATALVSSAMLLSTGCQSTPQGPANSNTPTGATTSRTTTAPATSAAGQKTPVVLPPGIELPAGFELPAGVAIPTPKDYDHIKLHNDSRGGARKGTITKCSEKTSNEVFADDERVRKEMNAIKPGWGDTYKGQEDDSWSLECDVTLQKAEEDHRSGVPPGTMTTAWSVSLPNGYDDKLKADLIADQKVDKVVNIGYYQTRGHNEKHSRTEYIATSVADVVSVKKVRTINVPPTTVAPAPVKSAPAPTPK